MKPKTTKSTIVRQFYVVVLLIIIGCLFGIVAVAVPHTQRGFYCNDDYITKPFNENQTVSTFLCFFLSTCMAISAIVLIDSYNIISYYRNFQLLSVASLFQLSAIQRYLVISVQCALFIGCGALLEQTILLVTKKTVGELRPHFISVCFPKIEEYYALCKNESYQTNYIMTDCPNADQHQVDEARLSFPSGHSSFIFYGAVTGILYIKSQLITKGSCFKMLSIAVQFSYFIFAWWVALTRIKDYWHHPWDVLIGASIGTSVALVIWRLSPIKYKRRELLRTGL